MKIYPDKDNKDNEFIERLSPYEAKGRKIAIVVAFVSVFFFLIKLLFL